MRTMSQEVPQRSGRGDWIVLALLALSLSANVLLGAGFLKLANAGPSNAASPAQPRPALAIGAQLPPLEAERLGGGKEVIRYSDDPRPTLIYVFTPSCQWCARNLPNLRTVIDAARRDYRIISVSLAPDVEEYVAATKLDVPVYVKVSADSLKAYALGSTPQTLVISPDSKLLHAWTGAYAGNASQEVERLFGVRLPGIVPITALAKQGGAW